MTKARVAITVGSEQSLWGYSYYADAVRAAGGEPFYCPPGCSPTVTFDMCDALIVTGGTDIDPTHYHEPRHRQTIFADLPRDLHEFRMLKAAWRENIPTLAICRGFQALNVVREGRLQQHIEADNHRPGWDGKPIYHGLELAPRSLLAKLFQNTTLEVNSRHHQAVRPGMVGKGLTIAATTPDGLVEALESPTHTFLVGVQWHPERPELREHQCQLFHALVLAGRTVLASKQYFETGKVLA